MGAERICNTLQMNESYHCDYFQRVQEIIAVICWLLENLFAFRFAEIKRIAIVRASRMYVIEMAQVHKLIYDHRGYYTYTNARAIEHNLV